MKGWLRSRQARPVAAVPRAGLALLALGLCAQVAWHGLLPKPDPRAVNLPPPPSRQALRLSAFGEPLVAARVLMLWLQAHDNQPGTSIPFIRMNYHRITGWLEAILGLDPKSRYPMLAAARLYGAVPDPEKARMAFDFVHRQFLLDPQHRWRWLAHAAIMAKHRLGDLPLALHYAKSLTRYAPGTDIPAWARDMSAIILEDMGELEAAEILIGGLIADGRITDENELRFLNSKLEKLAARRQAHGKRHRRSGQPRGHSRPLP